MARRCRTSNLRPARGARPGYVPAQSTLTADSQLIEGFLLTDGISVDNPTRSPRPLDIYINQDQLTEALIIAGGQLMQVCREQLSDSGWNVLGVGAGLQQVAAVDSASAYALDSAGNIWLDTLGKWTTIPVLPGASSAAAAISVTSDGVLFAVDTTSDGSLYQYSGTAWTKVQAGMWQPPVGNAQTGAWGFTSTNGGALQELAGGVWRGSLQPMPSDYISGIPVLSVASDATVCCFTQAIHLSPTPASPTTAPAPVWSWTEVTGPAGIDLQGAIAVTGGAAPVLYGFTATQVWRLSSGSWAMLGDTFPTGTAGVALSGSVAPDGTLWIVDGCGDVWKYFNTTWQRQISPVNLSAGVDTVICSQVVTGPDAMGNQWAIVIMNGALGYSRLQSCGKWSGLANVGDGQVMATSISKTYIAALSGSGAQLLVSAVTPGSGGESHLSFVTIGVNGPQLVTSSAGHSIHNAQAVTLPDGSSGCLTLAILGSSIQVAAGDLTQPLTKEFQKLSNNGSSVLPAFSTVVEIPCQQGNMIFGLAIDQNNYLWLLSDLSYSGADYIQLTGPNTTTGGGLLGTVLQVSTYIDSSNNCTIYAVDSNNLLWVLRQTGESKSGWQMTDWHPLGDVCIYLAHAPGSTATTELFSLDTSLLLNHLTQGPASNWIAQPVLQPQNAVTNPTATPAYVAQYITEVTVTDATAPFVGNPLTGVIVTVTAAEPVAVWSDNQQFLIDTSESADLVTDYRGKITVATIALGLHTPQLTFTCMQLTDAPTLVVYPPQNAQDTLSGLASSNDTTSWQNAKTQGEPSFTAGYTPPPLVNSDATANIKSVTTAMSGTFTIKTSREIQGNTITPAAGLIVRRSGVGHAATGQSLTLRSSDFWDELADFAHDVYHAIKNGIMAVTSVATDISQATLEIGLAIGKAEQQTLCFVVQTIYDVEGALSSAFQWLGAKIQEAIDFLKVLFDWGNILQTQQALEWFVNQALNNLRLTLTGDALKDFIDGKATTLRHEVNRAFEKLENKYSQSSVSSMNTQPSNAPSQTAGTNALSSNQVKSNSVHTRAQTYVNQGGKLPVSSNAGNTEFGDLVTAGKNATGSNSPFSNHLDKITVGSLTGLADTLLYDFLSRFQDLIDDAITATQGLLDQVLSIAAAAIVGLEDMLVAYVDIPVISWLFKEISGEQLTVMHLMSLIVAVPATLIYEIGYAGDGSPPFTSETQPQGSLPWPAIPSSSGLPPDLLATDTGPGLSAILQGTIYLSNALVYALVDTAGDIVNTANNIAASGEAENPITSFLSLANCFLSIVSAAVGYPDFTGNAAPIVNWACNVLQIVVDAIYLFGSENHVIAKLDGADGIGITMLFGLLNLATAIWAAIELFEAGGQSNLYSALDSLVASIPVFLKFLTLEEFNTEEIPGIAILATADAFGDVFDGVFGLVSYVVSDSSSANSSTPAKDLSGDV